MRKSSQQEWRETITLIGLLMLAGLACIAVVVLLELTT